MPPKRHVVFIMTRAGMDSCPRRILSREKNYGEETRCSSCSERARAHKPNSAKVAARNSFPVKCGLAPRAQSRAEVVVNSGAGHEPAGFPSRNIVRVVARLTAAT